MSPMAEAILKLVREVRTVSFAELENRIEGFGGGDVSWGVTSFNIVFWEGMTMEACDAMDELREAKLIEPIPTSPLTYMIDGKYLALPVVKSPRAYKKPHWAPIVFNSVM